MQPNSMNRVLNSWQQGGNPLTLAIIAINFLTMVLVTFRVPVVEWMMFVAPGWYLKPWTLLTYPLLSTRIISFLLHSLWLYSMGSSLERSWGTRSYAIYFFTMAAISALGIALGSAVLDVPDWAENWLPIAVLTVTFCWLNPHAEINIWGILPILARWLGFAVMLIVFFLYAQEHSHPLTGLFALTGCAAAILWVNFRSRHYSEGVSPLAGIANISLPKRATSTRSHTPRDDRFTIRDLNPLEWLARRRRKRQFERLIREDKERFERLMSDD